MFFYVNIRRGEQRDTFPENVVHGRMLRKCTGCKKHLRNAGAFHVHDKDGDAHFGGTVPAGFIPDCYDIEFEPSASPSIIVTRANRQCKNNSRAVEVIDYISLRARGAENACQSRGEVTFCTHHYTLPSAYNSHSMDDEAKRSRSFSVGIKRYL